MSASQPGAAPARDKQGFRDAGQGLKGAGIAGGVAVAGVLLSGVLIGGLLVAKSPVAKSSPDAALPAGSEIMTVAAADLAGATATLDPAQAVGLSSQAKKCEAPLALVVLSKAANAPDSVIRIRSGAYLSPAFHVGVAPIRVAIPFPTPYAVGRGRLIVEGPQQGLSVTLYPTWSQASMEKTGAIDIWWHTDKPCGG